MPLCPPLYASNSLSAFLSNPQNVSELLIGDDTGDPIDHTVAGALVRVKDTLDDSQLSEYFSDYSVVYETAALKAAGSTAVWAKGDTEPWYLKVDPKGKLAILDYELLAKKTDKNLVKISLKTGRSHQIRVQFSSRDHALFGDQRYNKEVIPHTQIALWSYSLSFNHPTLKNEMIFRSLPFDHPSFKDFKEVLQCLNKEELSADNSSSY